MLSRLKIGSRITLAILLTATLAAIISAVGVIGVRTIHRSVASSSAAVQTGLQRQNQQLQRKTLLSNLRHMRAMDFGYVPKLWDEWVAEADAPAIAPVRDVYLAARAKNLAIVFITGRKTSDQPGTENKLRAAGLGGYTRIFYKPNGYAGTTESFKTSIRKKLAEEEGYTIVANVGDQASDLAGGYAERTFKLPNPFYIAK